MTSCSQTISIWCGRLMIPWVGKSVGFVFLSTICHLMVKQDYSDFEKKKTINIEHWTSFIWRLDANFVNPVRVVRAFCVCRKSLSQNQCIHYLWKLQILTRLTSYWKSIACVIGVIKMGNIVPRAGIEPTSLAYKASVLPFQQVGSLMSPIYPHLPVYAAPYLRGRCSLLLSSPMEL